MIAIFLLKYLSNRQIELENYEEDRVLMRNSNEIKEFHQAESMEFYEKHENFLHKTQEFKTLPEYLFEALSKKNEGISLINLDFFKENIDFALFSWNIYAFK